MMLGFFLVMIVVLTVIWVISNVIRAQQEAAQQNARRNAGTRAAGSPPARQAQQHTSSDIEGFLQEIERLRQKNKEDKGRAAGKPATEREKPSRPRPPVVRPASEAPRVERPAPPPNPLAPPVPQRLEAMEPAPTKPAPPPPMPVAPVEPEPFTPRPAQTSAPVHGGRPGSLASSTAIPSTPTVTRVTGAAPPVVPNGTSVLLQSLLRSRQSAAVAIILAEIFGEPKSKKPSEGVLYSPRSASTEHPA